MMNCKLKQVMNRASKASKSLFGGVLEAAIGEKPY
jgi:hypothetical protein